MRQSSSKLVEIVQAKNIVSRFCSVPAGIMVHPKGVNSTTSSAMALPFPVLLHSGLEEFHQCPVSDTKKDIKETRRKPTPCEDTIEKNIKTFLEQWKDVDYEGMLLVPQCARDEVDKLLLHLRKGCLSNIPPTGGKSRNERILRVLNKSLKKFANWYSVCYCLALLHSFIFGTRNKPGRKSWKCLQLSHTLRQLITVILKEVSILE